MELKFKNPGGEQIMSKKIIFGLLWASIGGIAIVLVLTFLTYRELLAKDVTPSINTSNWQTYVNVKWNYMLKYPASWSVEESTELISSIRAWERQPKEYSDPYRDIDIIVYPNKDEWPNFERDLDQGRMEIKGSVTIAGLEATELREFAEKGFSYRIIVIQKGDRLYTITINEANPDMNIFNQILNTFEFIQ